MTKTNTRNRIVSILLALVMLLSLLPTTAFAAGSAETTDITEIKLTGDYQYGNVPAGILPAFNPGTTTDSITIDRTNSSWEYKMKSGGWSGFGLETPVAYNDGKTDYGYSFAVDTKAGYQLASDLKVIYNGVDVTSTDEIFGISAAQEGKVSVFYNYGAMCVAIPGWTLGTLAGGISGSLLPEFMLSALSVAIYGMFLAIIIPPSKKSRPVLGVVAASMAVSTVFAVTPVLKQVSSGFMIIITTLLVAGLAAYFCPLEEKGEAVHES